MDDRLGQFNFESFLCWKLMELIGDRSVQYSSTCQSGTQYRVFSIWGRGSGRVSQVPCLSNAKVLVGNLKNVFLLIFFSWLFALGQPFPWRTAVSHVSPSWTRSSRLLAASNLRQRKQMLIIDHYLALNFK